MLCPFDKAHLVVFSEVLLVLLLGLIAGRAVALIKFFSMACPYRVRRWKLRMAITAFPPKSKPIKPFDHMKWSSAAVVSISLELN